MHLALLGRLGLEVMVGGSMVPSGIYRCKDIEPGPVLQDRDGEGERGRERKGEGGREAESVWGVKERYRRT